jgi:hypothetical protein
MGPFDNRRSNLFRRDHNGTVGRSSSHLDSINRKIGDMPPLLHGSIGQEVSDDHYPLPTKPRDDEVIIETITRHKSTQYPMINDQ